ncbi:MAG: DUF6782 family putative metallopeptidase [Micavibrio sp.]
MPELKQKHIENNSIGISGRVFPKALRPMLGAAFLAAAQLLSGCNPVSPVTGEENLSGPVPFDKIQEQGDPRLKKIVAHLRKSTLGEQLYVYATKTGMQIEWKDKNDGTPGSYLLSKKIVTLYTGVPDANLTPVLAHELRHHWQNIEIDPNAWINGPVQQWQKARFIEADACAFTANFIAEYKDETGITLDLKYTYGTQASRNYVRLPKSERNYLRHAVNPCFTEIADYDSYEENHLEQAILRYNMTKLVHEKALLTGEYQETYNQYLNIPDDRGLKAQFSKFITPGLDPDRVIPEIRAATPEEFAQWMYRMTPSRNAELINAMQNHFEAMRQNIFQNIGQPKPATPGS